jgi:mercuric ion transport protein
MLRGLELKCGIRFELAHMAQLNAKGSLLAGVAAGIGASACCVGPLVLLMLGVSGAWIGNLTALEPYRPVFIGLTLLFLGLAFRKLYLAPPVCTPENGCIDPRVIRRQRLTFWTVAALLLCLLLVPVVVPLFYR